MVLRDNWEKDLYREATLARYRQTYFAIYIYNEKLNVLTKRQARGQMGVKGEGELDTTVEKDNSSWQSFKVLSVLFFFPLSSTEVDR